MGVATQRQAAAVTDAEGSGTSNLSLTLAQTVPHGAGALRNAAGVLMHVGATLVWPRGRRASFECSFDRAPVQHLEAGPCS